MKEYWDELFKNREKSFPHETILEKYIEIFRGKKLAELGAGDGRNSVYLAQKGMDITAFDYSQEGLEKLKKKIPNIKTRLIDIEKEQINLTDFQVILLIHYFPSFKKFKEIFETLEKESIVIIYTFIKDEVDGGRNAVGISYHEVEKLNFYGETIKKEFVDDPRGKSIFIKLKK